MKSAQKREVGRKLATARHRANLSQATLGDIVGRDQACISRLERGVWKELNMELLYALQRVLKFSIDDLFNITPERGTVEGIVSQIPLSAADQELIVTYIKRLIKTTIDEPSNPPPSTPWPRPEF